MAKFLLSSRDLHAIDRAADMADLNDACAYVQTVIGVTSGDVASVVLSGFHWAIADRHQRIMKLREYVRTEQLYS